jgi:alpha-N-arabinofuranosidase
MAAYAPLLAKKDRTQWNAANLIFFDNQTLYKTPNYYVQQLFSLNKGDVWLENDVSGSAATAISLSATKDRASGDIILKVVNVSEKNLATTIQLKDAGKIGSTATVALLSGGKQDQNSFEQPHKVKPEMQTLSVGATFEYMLPAMSVHVLRIPTE